MLLRFTALPGVHTWRLALYSLNFADVDNNCLGPDRCGTSRRYCHPNVLISTVIWSDPLARYGKCKIHGKPRRSVDCAKVGFNSSNLFRMGVITCLMENFRLVVRYQRWTKADSTGFRRSLNTSCAEECHFSITCVNILYCLEFRGVKLWNMAERIRNQKNETCSASTSMVSEDWAHFVKRVAAITCLPLQMVIRYRRLIFWGVKDVLPEKFLYDKFPSRFYCRC